jgi:hypothetical protein
MGEEPLERHERCAASRAKARSALPNPLDGVPAYDR